ncbi:MAG TPA: hypothetical protein DCS43_01920 [Verrucomicrobia bacterium]|nr:hypothetical protein [Verrucomicrobiota bacterium]
MKKSQIITLSLCGAGAVALLAAGFVLFKNVSRFNVANKSLENAKRQLAAVYNEPVFPSADNVTRERENTENLLTWFDELAGELGRGKAALKDGTPAQFIAILERFRYGLQQAAKAAGTEIPPQFAFGFDRYSGTGTLPSPSDVPRLTEQLELVARMCKILFDNRVKTIRLVERAVFEEGSSAVAGSATPPAAGEGLSRRQAAGQAAVSAVVALAPVDVRQAGIVQPGSLYGKYRFVLEFNAKESTLVGILNALTASPSFTVVKVLRLSNDVPVLMPDRAASPAGSGTEPMSGGVEGEPPAVAPDLATLRLGPNYPVCGLEMEVPMRVRLELDVFKFKGESNESGG